jgi:uncharacterized protein (DUF1800 family)
MRLASASDALISPPSAPLVSTSLTETAVLVGAGAVALATLTGCGGGGGGEGEGGSRVPPATATISSLTVKDNKGGALTVGGQTGTPAVTFALNGGSAGTNRAADPGPGTVTQTYEFAVSGSGGVGNIGITINPTPNDTASALHARLVATRASVAAMAFPPSWDELMGYAGMTHAQIVERLLGRLSGTPHEAYPAWIDEPILTVYEYVALSQAGKDAYNGLNKQRRQEFKSWFFRQMVISPDALSERLLLFWHNIFTSSITGLNRPQLMADQHRLYRQHFTGSMRTFLKAMCKDAGMCEYLDSSRNLKGQPNENFARELLELFTLGESKTFGGYDEAVIPVVAQCFTGYGVDARMKFQFNIANHDSTPVTLWGQVSQGTAADGDWVIDQILAKVDVRGHSYCAVYLVTRLWREFIGDPESAQAAIWALADQFSGTFDWNLTRLYRALFNRPEFSDAARNGTRMRSPVELFVGFYRPLAIRPVKWEDPYLWMLQALDQDLFDPPSVFGWPGGTSWITVKTLVDRREFMKWIGRDYGNQVPERLLNVLDILLLATDPIGATPSGSTAAARARQYITDPAYNLR